MDHWLAARLGPLLRSAADPLVVDLGYGATPVTAVELVDRLGRVRADVRVLLMSGYSEALLAAHGPLPRGTEWLSKPFTTQALRDAVAEMLR